MTRVLVQTISSRETLYAAQGPCGQKGTYLHPILSHLRKSDYRNLPATLRGVVSLTTNCATEKLTDSESQTNITTALNLCGMCRCSFFIPLLTFAEIYCQQKHQPWLDGSSFGTCLVFRSDIASTGHDVLASHIRKAYSLSRLQQ